MEWKLEYELINCNKNFAGSSTAMWGTGCSTVASSSPRIQWRSKSGKNSPRTKVTPIKLMLRMRLMILLMIIRFNMGDGKFGAAYAQEDGVAFKEESTGNNERIGKIQLMMRILMMVVIFQDSTVTWMRMATPLLLSTQLESMVSGKYSFIFYIWWPFISFHNQNWLPPCLCPLIVTKMHMDIGFIIGFHWTFMLINWMKLTESLYFYKNGCLQYFELNWICCIQFLHYSITQEAI